MAEVFTVTAIWQGFPGAPGYTKLRYELLNTQGDIDAAVANVRTFFMGIAGYLSTGWTVTVQRNLQVNDMATGILLREVSATTSPAPVAGSSSTATWAGGAGAFIGWKTAVVFLGRRVQGRTFLVPLRGIQQTDGSLLDAGLSAIQSAANTLLAGPPPLCVWAKQFTTGANGKPQQVGGAIVPVTAAIIPDKTGILRSRRD